MSRKAYDSALTDEQWEIIKPYMEKRHALGWGRPRIVDPREVVKAIFYQQFPLYLVRINR